MSDFETIPYRDYDAAVAEGSLLTGGAATAIAPAAYQGQMRRVLAYHTGSAETFLSVEQDHALAAKIQAGYAARAERTSLKAQIDQVEEKPSSLLAQYRQANATARAGRRAEQKLVECNLRLAAYLARVSMNIMPDGDDTAPEGSKGAARYGAIHNSNHRWIPQDFTSLRSRHANLDDRTQVANEGLLRAARTFKPGRRNDQGELVAFKSFAAPVIQTVLARYARVHERPLYLPLHTFEGISLAHADDWADHLTPEKREELLEAERVSQDFMPLDDLQFIGGASEEDDSSADEPGVLTLQEAVSFHPFNIGSLGSFGRLLARNRNAAIEAVLETLSEREAGCIRLRFGLTDGQPRTLDEIGQVYGLTREGARTVEAGAMSKLRHPARANFLRDYAAYAGDIPPTRSGDVVVTGRGVGRSAFQLVVTRPESGTRRAPHESWQAYAGESWDIPMRQSPAQLEATYETTARRLQRLIFGASLYTFQKSFAEDMGSPYPQILTERILTTLDRELEPEHIADFWNDHLEAFLDHINEELGDDASADRATQLLSRLLAERMHDDDMVDLHIPESLQGRLGYVGAWLSHGVVRVHGDLGNYAGYAMNQLGHLQVDGSVQSLAGSDMRDYARLDIDGDGGRFLGARLTGNASILVNGNAQDYCGAQMAGKEGLIEVIGDAGDKLGFEAVSGEIVVGGVITAVAARRNPNLVIRGAVRPVA